MSERWLPIASRAHGAFVAMMFWLAVFLIVLAWSATRSESAELTGPGAAWVRSIEAHAPGPAGPAIYIGFGECPGLAEAGACWRPWASEIWLSTARDEITMMHELAHAVDSRNYDDAERTSLTGLLGYPPGTPWVAKGDPFCKHSACPSERAASVYAGCALLLKLLTFNHSDGTGHVASRHAVVDPWWGAAGWRVNRAHYARVCRVMRAYARTV
jgi:hypothetical protein